MIGGSRKVIEERVKLHMIEMAGKEYLLKLRDKQDQMKDEIVSLIVEKGQLTFQEIYMQMEEKYHKYCTVPDAEEGILEGVLKNLLTILVYQKQVIEIPVMGGAKYASTGRDMGQEISHAA